MFFCQPPPLAYNYLLLSGAWADHGQGTGGFYKCNRFIPADEKLVEKAKAELERYLHYYQR